jgi:biopolymer transport protein ExbB
MNIERAFNSAAHLGAGWVLWLLIGLSVVGFGIMLERLLFFLLTRQSSEALKVLIERAFSDKNSLQVRRKLDEMASLEARILSAGLIATLPEEAEQRMAAETQLQRIRAEKNLAFLGTLGNNAPFVGLLGTVIGIMGAFAQLDASSGQLTSGLMAEIGEALVATAVGLLVALPAVAAYNFFQRIISVRLSQGDALGRYLIATLLSQADQPPKSERRGKEAQ